MTGVTWRVVDVRDPVLAGRLSGVDVIVHTDLDLAPDSDSQARRAYNVRGAQTVLTAAAAGGVGRVVLVTSAMVYGASPDNPVPMPEDAPLGADPDGSVVGDFLEIEQLARAVAAHPSRHVEVTVVRPAALVGAGMDTLVTRHFEAPRLLAVKGCAPRWQFCHVDDLVSALELAAGGRGHGRVRGRLRRLARTGAGRGAVRPAPDRAAGRASRSRPRSGCTARASPRPRWLTCTMSSTRGWSTARHCAQQGWRPTMTTPRRCEVLLAESAGHHAVAGRRLAKKDATITAAGATVAVIGTAAIVRQVRAPAQGILTVRLAVARSRTAAWRPGARLKVT